MRGRLHALISRHAALRRFPLPLPLRHVGLRRPGRKRHPVRTGRAGPGRRSGPHAAVRRRFADAADPRAGRRRFHLGGVLGHCRIPERRLPRHAAVPGRTQGPRAGQAGPGLAAQRSDADPRRTLHRGRVLWAQRARAVARRAAVRPAPVRRGQPSAGPRGRASVRRMVDRRCGSGPDVEPARAQRRSGAGASGRLRRQSVAAPLGAALGESSAPPAVAAGRSMIPALEALERLRAGNRRFVSGAAAQATGNRNHRGDLAYSQQPFAAILGCSDSRVPVEIVFDQGPGDLFVIRVAGNVVAPSQIGSVEFATEQFGTRLVVVLGHSRCGAVTATIDQLQRPPERQSRNLQSIVDRIRPSVQALLSTDLRHDPQALMRQAVRANIRASVDHLRHGSQLIEQMIERAGLQILGAEYSLETGEVDFFEGP